MVCGWVGYAYFSQGRYALALWLSDTYLLTYLVLEQLIKLHEVRASCLVLGKHSEWIVI